MLTSPSRRRMSCSILSLPDDRLLNAANGRKFRLPAKLRSLTFRLTSWFGCTRGVMSTLTPTSNIGELRVHQRVYRRGANADAGLEATRGDRHAAANTSTWPAVRQSSEFPDFE